MDAALLDRRLHFLTRRLAQAQRRFQLIADGDRVAVGLSGGKDSTALLLALMHARRTLRETFDVVAVHVEIAGANDRDARRAHLTRIAELAGVPLSLAPLAADRPLPAGSRPTHPCFRCSWRRREALFRSAAAHGCAKVALGHHLDDAAETALMNLLYKGRLESLAPRREFFDGAVTLIRPLILAEEKELARVSACLDEPPTRCTCAEGGQEPDSARRQMKDLLRSLGKASTAAKRHLWRASLHQAD